MSSLLPYRVLPLDARLLDSVTCVSDRQISRLIGLGMDGKQGAATVESMRGVKVRILGPTTLYLFK